MNRSSLARELGRLGGVTRARQGGQAKHASRLAEQRIGENMSYLQAMLEIRPAPPVKRRRTCAHPLPDVRDRVNSR